MEETSALLTRRILRILVTKNQSVNFCTAMRETDRQNYFFIMMKCGFLISTLSENNKSHQSSSPSNFEKFKQIQSTWNIIANVL